VNERTGRAPRIAIVSDPLVQRGGAERVVEVLARTFPDAPIFAILYSAERGPASLAERIVPSPLARIPGATRRHRWLLPLYPQTVESFDLSDYDIIVSSHHTAAKGVLRNARQFHLCYCHTPMRALWERGPAEVRSFPAIARPFAARSLRELRAWDLATTQRVDAFVANSETTRRRIAVHYGRESTVLTPPIDTEAFTPAIRPALGEYYLVASRAVPYKRLDLAIAATALAGRRLVIVGGTPREAAGQSHVVLRGHVGHAELLELMRGARALLFPGEEDFGMTPVETMACGRPVIAYGAGGATETVLDGVTGVFAREQSAAAFADAIARFETLHFDPARIRLHAERFGQAAFISGIRRLAYDGWEARRAQLRGEPQAQPAESFAAG
jgi:glycosyltransferase involved in cell wall biosynthesis